MYPLGNTALVLPEVLVKSCGKFKQNTNRQKLSLEQVGKHNQQSAGVLSESSNLDTTVVPLGLGDLPRVMIESLKRNVGSYWSPFTETD